MHKHKKKVIFSIVFTVLITMMCPGNINSVLATEDKTSLTGLFIAHPLTRDINEMEWIKELEDEAGVEVEWEQIYTDWDQTKSTRFASGDIPDLLFNATNDADYVTYNGLFLDLEPYLGEDLTPNIVSMFEEEPDTKVLATDIDGKIYGLPKFQGKWPSTNPVMYINETWLSSLGLDKPKTFSELKDVLIAFRDQDPNENNIADEIPLDFNGWFGAAYSLTQWVGSLGIQLVDWAPGAYFAEDYEIKSYAVDERYKLLMEYLADLWSENLINPNAITNDYSMYQSLSRGNENGDAIVGLTFGWESTDKFGPDLYKEYSALTPLIYDIDTDPDTYDLRWINDYSGLNMSGNRVAISEFTENPEACLKFVDLFYGETASVEGLFGGISDGNIRKDGDNEYTVLPPPEDAHTDPGTWKWTSTLADNAPMYIRRDTIINFQFDMENALLERESYNDIVDKMQESEYYPQMFMKYTEDEQNTLALYQTSINNIIDNYWALWLTGESDIQADWDMYVQAVEEAGLTEVLRIRQAAFDRYLENID